MQELELEGSGGRLHDADLLEDVLQDGAQEGRILWWIGGQAMPVVGCGAPPGAGRVGGREAKHGTAAGGLPFGGSAAPGRQ